MAALGRRLQGTVKSPAGDASARASKVIVTRGGSLVAQARVGRDGAFRVAVPDEPDLVVTVFGLDNRVLRRRIKDEPERTDNPDQLRLSFPSLAEVPSQDWWESEVALSPA